MKTNDGGAAFPGQRLGSDGRPECEASPGMTLRDYFAAAALTGIVAAEGAAITPPEDAARRAWEFADAMLTARNPLPTPT